MITPIFKSQFSLQGRSILTLDKDTDIKDNYPVSIGGIVKKYGMKEVYLVEDNMSGFFDAYELFNKLGVLLKFGVAINLVNDPNEKEDRNESKLWVFVKNNQGYKDLCKLWNAYSLNKDLFYYYPRMLWSQFDSLVTPNLQVVVPPYDSFLYKNDFCRGNTTPFFTGYKPITTFCSGMDLHFGDELEATVKKYDTNAQQVHLCYYYKDADYLPWLTMKCIAAGTTFDDPNLEWCTSDKFSFESYCKKSNIQFLS